MKILLLNNNPVVNKLVTLSAQKTSDELEVVSSIDDIEEKSYDLVVIDDTLYNEDLLEDIKSKINFQKSLFICARDAKEVGGFTTILKKPFLPTDLVDIFASFAKELSTIELGDSDSSDMEDLATSLDDGSLESEIDLTDDLEDLEDLEDLSDLHGLDDISLDDELLSEEEDISADDVLSLDTFDLSDMSLDDDLSFEDDDIESLGESVLDKDELQEVQELLEDTEEDSEDLDLDITEINSGSLSNADAITDIDELSLDEFDLDLHEMNPSSSTQSDAISALDELDELEEFGDDEELLENKELDFDSEENDEDLELEALIENAVDELSEEDLESELDEDMLEDVATSDFQGIDSLTSRDLKMAIGEELNAYDFGEAELGDAIEEQHQEKGEIVPDNKGVEALKQLLKALSNEDVAASLKGMKININITLGDE